MSSDVIYYYENYTPVGDILTIAMCMVFAVLIKTAYIKRTKNFVYLRMMIILLLGAAFSDMIYHISMNYIGELPYIVHYFFRAAFHLCIFANLLLYVLYMKEPLHLDAKLDKRFGILAGMGYVVIAALEVLGTMTGRGFYIDETGYVHTGFPIFPIGYMFYIGIITYMLIVYRNRVFKQVISGVSITAGISVLLICLQQIHGQSSFTVATFALPIIALLYLLHSNPYDLDSGALGRDAFDDFIRSSYEKKRKLLLMSLYMHEFDSGDKTYPPEILSTIRFFVVHFFKTANLFKLSGGHLILVADIKKNPDYKDSAAKMVSEFNRVYPRYKKDYKIVSLYDNEKLSIHKDYSGFLSYIHDIMPENSIYHVEEKDYKNYYDHQYIMSQLADINAKQDLNDPRVDVYCQPVYNIRKGIYDTAEALMRLNLPEIGMVFPDKFIPIAEQNNYIQILTKIILNKTCRQISTMIRQGYNVRRISVNFSIFDVRERDFCSTVEKIIRDNGIANDQIAIEITESQNDKDFDVIKEKITELKDSGIKFYLDDFGTGYSNFERIMELPFDIIKFDRSLVISSGNDEKMQEMVSHLAKMFSDMDYAVLYEGVEDDADEARCIDMSAKYLQGYKYSKPIPIKQLTEYFEKNVG